jgi:hypothetical protein
MAIKEFSKKNLAQVEPTFRVMDTSAVLDGSIPAAEAFLTNTEN